MKYNTFSAKILVINEKQISLFKPEHCRLLKQSVNEKSPLLTYYHRVNINILSKSDIILINYSLIISMD